MKFHVLRHVPFEGPALIENWLQERGHSATVSRLYQPDDRLPRVDEFAALVIMGGPMSVHETENYPWLAAEQALIREALQQRIPLLGICLGAQLIAQSLGAEVQAGEQQEIGWHPLHWERRAQEHPILHGLQEQDATVFHWHGDFFTLPEDALPLAASAACPCQGFLHDERSLALQFHVEMAEPHIRKLIENCYEDAVPGPYVQSRKKIITQCPVHQPGCKTLLYALLDNWLSLWQTARKRPDPA